MAGRRRWTMRHAAWAAAAVAIGTARFISAMGLRHDRAIDRLAAEGAVTQGRALPRNYGSCRGGSCASDVVDVEYSVGGRRYFTYQTIPSDPDRKPILEPRLVGVPRLGPERPFQVVYLPADPAVARVRALASSTISAASTASP